MMQSLSRLEGEGLPLLLGGVLAIGVSFALWFAIILGGWHVLG